VDLWETESNGSEDEDEFDGHFAEWADESQKFLESGAVKRQREADSTISVGYPIPCMVAAESSLGPVPEVQHLPTAEEFRLRWRNKWPLLVVRGLACRDCWGPFADGWEDTSLIDAIAEHELVSCFVSPKDGRTFLRRGGICEELRVPWKDAVLAAAGQTERRTGAAITAADLLYVGNVDENFVDGSLTRAYTRANLSSLVPSVKENINLARLEQVVGGAFKLDLCGVWVSSPGCITPLHFDLCHGLLCQVRGRKRVLLAEPLATRSLYLRAPGDANPQSSYIDAFKWLTGDVEQRSKFAKVGTVDWHEVVLEPGQALYIPPLWWHAVETLEEASVSILLPFDPLPGEIQHPCGVLATTV
jgi:hypothetical protein